MNNILISVIIPVYNQAKYISDCILSVINQTYKNLEIIIINDGSNDNSLDIIKSFKKLDNRIKIINQKNQGVYKSRCNGVEIAKGKYITFLDADDMLEKKFIEILVDKIEKTDADIIRCNFKKMKDEIYTNNVFKLNCGFYKKSTYENNIYKYIYTTLDLNSVCCQLIKTEIIKKAVTKKYNLKYGEDLIFNCEIINLSNSMLIIPNHLYIYRTNDNSYSHNRNIDIINAKIIDILKYTCILEKFIYKWNINNKDEYLSYLCFNMYKNFIYQFILINNREDYNKIIDIIKKDKGYINLLNVNIKYKKNFKNLCIGFLIFLFKHKYYNILYVSFKILSKFL